jgi:site-specific DNA recombinase
MSARNAKCSSSFCDERANRSCDQQFGESVVVVDHQHAFSPRLFAVGKAAPDRREQLLAGLLENSNAATSRRRTEMIEARKQETIARSAITRLLELIETGVMSARDLPFAEQLAVQKSALAIASSRVQSLDRQLLSGKRRITPHAIARFSEFMREQLRGPDQALRSAYVRLRLQEVMLSDTAITVHGSKAALEHALIKGEQPLKGVVPVFDREWCPEEDSNLHALSSAST